jgi:hypothetical protein
MSRRPRGRRVDKMIVPGEAAPEVVAGSVALDDLSWPYLRGVLA